MEKKATFGAGCFWGVEAAFRQLDGVTADARSATRAARWRTRPTRTSARTGPVTPRSSRSPTTPSGSRTTQLLDVFWGKHDPTQLNRQGWDIGDQLPLRRSSSTTTRSSEAAAERSKAESSGARRAPIVTQIEPARDVLRG